MIAHDPVQAPGPGTLRSLPGNPWSDSLAVVEWSGKTGFHDGGKAMRQRTLGASGIGVSAIGLGCWGMSGSYGPADEAESVATLHHALDLGVNFIDTADSYGDGGHNEALIGRTLEVRRHGFVLATKTGWVRRAGQEGKEVIGVDGRPGRIRSACEASLARLRTDVIDLYYLHRVDPDVPVEESVGAMSELVAAGKVRFLGLSEVSEATL